MSLTSLTILVTLLVVGTYCDNSTCHGINGFTNTSMDFTLWDNVLKRHVSKGVVGGIDINVVNYTGVAMDPDFETFGCQLRNSDVQDLSYEQWYAFYINAYNYYAVWTIIDNACIAGLFGNCTSITSIQQVGFLWPSFTWNARVWDMNSTVIAGEYLSLNDIEHHRLRDPRAGGFDVEDPRLHACIVCASVSCPNLRDEAYTVENLYVQMEDNVKQFLNNTKKGLNFSNGKLTISPIFNWFFDDFNNGTRDGIQSSSKSLSSFLVAHISEASTIKYIQDNADSINAQKLNVFSYDWNLNGEVGDLCTTKSVCISPLVLVIAGSIIAVLILLIAIAACSGGKKEGYSKVR